MCIHIARVSRTNNYASFKGKQPCSLLIPFEIKWINSDYVRAMEIGPSAPVQVLEAGTAPSPKPRLYALKLP